MSGTSNTTRKVRTPPARTCSPCGTLIVLKVARACEVL